MLESTNLYKESRRRLDELREVYHQVQKRYESSPPGKLHILKTNRRIQYYLRQGPKDKSGTYLRKSDNKKRIQIYLQKSYDEKLLPLLAKEVEGLEKFLLKYQDIPNQIQNLYGIYAIDERFKVKTVDCCDEEWIREWTSVTYAGKTIAEDAPEFYTHKGERVRSKSELTIANALYEHRIPYRYECPIKLQNGWTVYPDFTILDVKRRKNIYWEHRGMMDDREYARGAVAKQKEYAKSGIILGDNLIITEETVQAPLGTPEIEKMISTFLL